MSPPPPQSHHHNGLSGFPGYQPPRVPTKTAAAGNTTTTVRTRKAQYSSLPRQQAQHPLLASSSTSPNDRLSKPQSSTPTSDAEVKTNNINSILGHRASNGDTSAGILSVPASQYMSTTHNHSTTAATSSSTHHITSSTAGTVHQGKTTVHSALSTGPGVPNATPVSGTTKSQPPVGMGHLSALVGKMRSTLKSHNGAPTGSEQPLASSSAPRRKYNQATQKPPSKLKPAEGGRSGVEDVRASANQSTNFANANPGCNGSSSTRKISALHEEYLKLYCKKFDFDELEVLKKIYKELCERNSAEKGIDKQTFLQYFTFPGMWGERLFQKFNFNATGYVNYVEFLVGIAVCCRGTKAEKIRVVFEMFDLDGDGLLSKLELVAMLSSLPNVDHCLSSTLTTASSSYHNRAQLQQHYLRSSPSFHDTHRLDVPHTANKVGIHLSHSNPAFSGCHEPGQQDLAGAGTASKFLNALPNTVSTNMMLTGSGSALGRVGAPLIDSRRDSDPAIEQEDEYENCTADDHDDDGDDDEDEGSDGEDCLDVICSDTGDEDKTQKAAVLQGVESGEVAKSISSTPARPVSVRGTVPTNPSKAARELINQEQLDMCGKYSDVEAIVDHIFEECDSANEGGLTAFEFKSWLERHENILEMFVTGLHEEVWGLQGNALYRQHGMNHSASAATFKSAYPATISSSSSRVGCRVSGHDVDMPADGKQYLEQFQKILRLFNHATHDPASTAGPLPLSTPANRPPTTTTASPPPALASGMSSSSTTSSHHPHGNLHLHATPSKYRPTATIGQSASDRSDQISSFTPKQIVRGDGQFIPSITVKPAGTTTKEFGTQLDTASTGPEDSCSSWPEFAKASQELVHGSSGDAKQVPNANAIKVDTQDLFSCPNCSAPLFVCPRCGQHFPRLRIEERSISVECLTCNEVGASPFFACWHCTWDFSRAIDLTDVQLTANAPIFEGALYKRQPTGDSWSTSHYILIGNLLYYYDRKDDPRPAGFHFLEDCYVEPFEAPLLNSSRKQLSTKVPCLTTGGCASTLNSSVGAPNAQQASSLSSSGVDKNNDTRLLRSATHATNRDTVIGVHNGKYGFSICHAGRKILQRDLFANTEEECRKWIEHLKKAMKQQNIEDIYEIQEKIGKGKFSVVYRGVSRLTGHEVAIKAIKKDRLSSQERELLRSEISVLRLLRHHHVVHLEEVFDSKGALHIVMELVKGGELFDLLAQKRRLSELHTNRIIRQLLQTVGYLHKCGIIHRDLKPENVLLTDKTSEADVKLTDFGLACICGPKELLSQPCGTMAYVAPEVLSLNGYSHTADVWSVGVITYLLLSGRLPFAINRSQRQPPTKRNYTLDFSGSVWGNVSTSAKDFVSMLLQPKPKHRVTVARALEHVWIRNPTAAIDEAPDDRSSISDYVLDFLAESSATPEALFDVSASTFTIGNQT